MTTIIETPPCFISFLLSSIINQLIKNEIIPFLIQLKTRVMLRQMPRHFNSLDYSWAEVAM